MMLNETTLGRRLPPVIIRELVVPEPSEVLLGTSLVDLRREHNSQRTKLPLPRITLHVRSTATAARQVLTYLTSAGVSLNVMARK